MSNSDTNYSSEKAVEKEQIGYTYHITICSPLHNIPFNCYIPSWIKRVICFYILKQKKKDNFSFFKLFKERNCEHHKTIHQPINFAQKYGFDYAFTFQIQPNVRYHKLQFFCTQTKLGEYSLNYFFKLKISYRSFQNCTTLATNMTIIS